MPCRSLRTIDVGAERSLELGTLTLRLLLGLLVAATLLVEVLVLFDLEQCVEVFVVLEYRQVVRRLIRDIVNDGQGFAVLDQILANGFVANMRCKVQWCVVLVGSSLSKESNVIVIVSE